MRTTPASCGTNSRVVRVRLSWNRNVAVATWPPGYLRFAKLQMIDDLHIDERAYGFASSLFFLGLLIFVVGRSTT